MKFTRSGFILYVNEYKECIEFYQKILGLKIMFETQKLTCFLFEESYLMVEKQDEPEYMSLTGKELKTFTCLRMNVPNVKKRANKLRAMGVDVNYAEFDWGIVAKFFDPAGNLLSFKDDKTFEKQITEYNTQLK